MLFELQGRPGAKGEPGLTVSSAITQSFFFFSHLKKFSMTCFLCIFQREEIIKLIREICGKTS